MENVNIVSKVYHIAIKVLTFYFNTNMQNNE